MKRCLDLSKLEKRENVFVSAKEALKDVAPIRWSKEVLTGKKKVAVSTYEKKF